MDRMVFVRKQMGIMSCTPKKKNNLIFVRVTTRNSEQTELSSCITRRAIFSFSNQLQSVVRLIVIKKIS